MSQDKILFLSKFRTLVKRRKKYEEVFICNPIN